MLTNSEAITFLPEFPFDFKRAAFFFTHALHWPSMQSAHASSCDHAK
jgi:hypothetical protein